MNGSIRKRGQNSWELTIHLGKDEHGKRKRQFVNVKGRKAYADKRLRELLAAAEKGLPIDTSKLSVGDYLDRWHRDYVHPNTRPRTVDRYLGDITNHLKPLLGHLPLSKVSPADVQRMEATLIAKGLSPRSVEHAHRVLSQSFKHATGWGLTWRNPCDSVRPPRKVQKELSIQVDPIIRTAVRLK